MQRKQYSADFKARVVLKALSGESTTAELAKKFSIHPLMITKWKKQAVTALPSLFSRKPERQKEEWSQRESELFQKIGKLQYELDWLKKKAASFD